MGKILRVSADPSGDKNVQGKDDRCTGIEDHGGDGKDCGPVMAETVKITPEKNNSCRQSSFCDMEICSISSG